MILSLAACTVGAIARAKEKVRGYAQPVICNLSLRLGKYGSTCALTARQGWTWRPWRRHCPHLSPCDARSLLLVTSRARLRRVR